MRYIIVVFTICLAAHPAWPQGCIAIRNISGFGQHITGENRYSEANWLLSIDNRYYKSNKSYEGKKNAGLSKNDEVVIESFSTSFTLSRLMKKGWSVSLSLPVSANARTSTEQHGGLGTPRHTTHSFGAGDLQLKVYKWLLRPTPVQKSNVQVGLGLKFPTGDYNYKDYFYLNDTTKVLANVEIPIQPGDGGTGIITEVNTFFNLNSYLGFYGNFYYLVNPREQNGALNTYGRTPSDIQIKSGYYVASVPDQYSIRAGASLDLDELKLSFGVRDDGVPVYDLIGGSNGARKAGYNFSIEPGILYRVKNVLFYGYVPVVVAREIKQNVPDKILSEMMGETIIKHGGSPDIMFIAGVSFDF